MVNYITRGRCTSNPFITEKC